MANPLFNLNLTVINNCDAATGWSGSPITEPDIKKEGTNSLLEAIRNGGTLTYSGGTFDMSAPDTHLRLWLFHSFFGRLQLASAGGIQLFVTGGGATNFYYVGGSDTHEGSWELFQANLANPSINGGANLASVTACGFVLDHATATRNVDNTYFDYFVFGKGYGIYGGTSGDKVSWLTMASTDATNGYGITQLQQGVIFLNGEVLIGDNVGTNNTFFDGDNELVVFYDRLESETLYKINFVGNATGTTDITLRNTVIKSASTRFEFNANDANITSFLMTGSTLDTAGLIDFTGGQTITGNVFQNTGQINPRNSTFSDNIIGGYIEAGSNGALLLSDDTSISNLTFNSSGTGHAILITTPGTYSITNFTYNGYASTNGSTGNEVFYNNSGGAVTLNIVGGTPPTVRNGAGATTTVNNNINVTLTDMFQNTEVRVYLAGTSTLVSGIENVIIQEPGNTNPNNYTFTFSLAAGVSVDIRIFHLSYLPVNLLSESFDSNIAITVQQVVDRNYLNPA